MAPNVNKDHYCLLVLVTVILLCLLACGEDPPFEEPDTTEKGARADTSDIPETGAWVTYSPYKWPHDGSPCVSEYCIVYSDSAHYELKKKCGHFADARFLEVLEWFGFDRQADFLYPPGHSKIDVYLERTREENMAAAYWGVVIMSLNAPDLDTNSRVYHYLFGHELTHVFEFLIEGRVNLGTDVWFREGIAICGGGGINRIRDRSDLEEWILKNSGAPNKGNPVSIHRWEDFPEGSDITGYYTVFEIVMRILLDPAGTNRSLQDVVNLFYDVREGTPFEDAFPDNFGLSLAELEDCIFDLMMDYLPESE